ncbi:MAG: glycoside hydrolase family 3 N-terminal domain-containing protein [Bryobacteraceae bacterium]
MQVRDRLAGALAAGLLLVSLVTPATVAATGVKPPPKTQAGRAATSAAARQASGENRRAAAQARKWIARMSLRERIAQLVMAPVYGDSPNARSREYREYLSLVAGVKVGGLVVLNRVRDGAAQRAEPHAAAAFLNRMQRLSKTPLIVAGDFERGASMRVLHTTAFPYAMAFGAAGDLDSTRALGRATAREARAMGIQWIFAPVADVNNNPDNPIINLRSFGADPQAVAAHVRAFIEGAHSDPHNAVLVTAKHFPGHGDTDIDSHLDLPRLAVSRERLEQVELVPFQAAIAAGVDAIMTAHIATPALDSKDEPATLSKSIVSGLLREELKFNGLIVTDALDMQAVAKLHGPGDTCVRALEAGADLLLAPADPKECVRAVAAAVTAGGLTRERIDASVLKLLTAKARLGLQKKLVDLESIPDSLDAPEDQALATSVAEKALTLVRNENVAGGAALLPLAQPDRACWFVLTNGRYSTAGRDLVEAVKQRSRGAQVTLVDPQFPASQLDALAAQAESACDAVVVAAFSGQAALPGNDPAFVEKLSAGERPVALLAMSSPYLLRACPNVKAYLAAFGAVAASEVAAVRAVLGEIGVSGRMPVSIPGFAQIGDGLRIAPRVSEPRP